MFKELANVLKITKSRHLFKALTSPSHTFRRFKYHYRRGSERDFVEFFARRFGYSAKIIDKTYEDLENKSGLWEEIRQKLSAYPNNYGLQMTRELSALYLLVRLFQPTHMVETGVSAGVSSAYILSAMEDNNRGRLYSIDLPPDNLPKSKTVGWVVPDQLRSRWSLHIGNALDLLESLLSDIGNIDCFLHDSLHTYEHTSWEFNTAWKYLCLKGLFLSHDVGANDAFVDFMSKNGISWKDYRVFHVLGALQKPQK